MARTSIEVAELVAVAKETEAGIATESLPATLIEQWVRYILKPLSGINLSDPRRRVIFIDILDQWISEE